MRLFVFIVVDMVFHLTSAASHYKLAIILSVLDPPCTLMFSLHYIGRVGLPFAFFELLNGIFFEA